MSVQSEIDRIAGAKSDISTAITNKGVTVPSGTKLDGMAALIDSIVSGGGSGGGALSVETGTVTSTKKTSAPFKYDYTFDLSPITNLNDRLVIILIYPNSYRPGYINSGTDVLVVLVRSNKSDEFCMYMGGGLEECTTFSMRASRLNLIEASIINSSLETPAYIAI